MYDVLPHIMARAQRGICPTCGAPMKLGESGRDVACDFCGGESSLSFRLRAVEPDVAQLEKAKIKGATRVLEKQATFESCTCPGCGATFEADTAQLIQTCRYCGAQSKLETRLVPLTTKDVEPPQERTRADFENQRRDRIDYPWDVETEQLVWRVIHEPDLVHRVALAGNFENWNFINHTSAHFLPWLLEHVQQDHDAVAIEACDVIGKLLCEGDKTLWAPVIQACRGVVFNEQGKIQILHGLGLGTGVCVKTLIDAAEFGHAKGSRDYACHALWAVQTLIGRNFEEHETIAQVVLYRLFYLTGPVLGWALDALRSGYLRANYPLEYLVQVTDELGIERPEIVPHLLECVYYIDAKNADEFRTRLDWIRNALSWGGVAIGFELMRDPPGGDPQLYAEALELVDRYLDDERNAEHAEGALYRLLNGTKKTPPAFDELVKQRGENLSYRVKREYIRRNPDTELLDTSQRYYWQSEPKRELDPQMQKLVEEWKQGIRDSVDRRDEISKQAAELRAQARKVSAPIFQKDEPPTIMPKVEQPEEEPEDEPEMPADAAELSRLQQEYSTRMQELSAKMMENMQDSKLVQELSDEITHLSAELQQKMRDILGE